MSAIRRLIEAKGRGDKLTDDERQEIDERTVSHAVTVAARMYERARRQPAFAEYVAWTRWGRLCSDDGGIPGDAVAAARWALEAASEPDDQAVIDRLARAVSEHAARFRDSVTWPRVKLDADRAAMLRAHLDRPDPITGGARGPGGIPWDVDDDDTLTAWQAAALAPHDAHRADARERGEPLTDDERAEVAALVKVPDELDAATLGRAADGVPWLSEELGRYLHELDPTVGEKWRRREREREEARRQQLDLDGGPGLYLSGWLEAADATAQLPAAALSLALAVWRGEVQAKVERGRAHLVGYPLALFDQLAGTSGARRARTYEDRGRAIAAYALADGGEVRADLYGLPDRVLRSFHAPKLAPGVSHVRALWFVVEAIGKRFAEGDLPWDAVPKIPIPKGRALARALGLSDSGRGAHEADDAIRWLAALRFDGARDEELALWHLESVRCAPGRPTAWIVTPGEVLRPTYSRRTPPHARDWKRLFVNPDELPPDEWAARNVRAQVGLLGLRLAAEWARASGREHGERWLARRGVVVDDDLWGRLDAPHLDQRETIAQLVDSEWATFDGDVIAPGARLPRLRATLDDYAETRPGKDRPKKRRK